MSKKKTKKEVIQNPEQHDVLEVFDAVKYWFDQLPERERRLLAVAIFEIYAGV